MGKRLILNESQFNQLIANEILTESSNSDIFKSSEFEKRVKDIVTSTIKNDKQSEKELEKKVREIVAKTVNIFFRTLWQRSNFYEDSIKNG